MQVSVIGTESLGVRGLSCLVEVKGRRIVIDPGLALGYLRFGLLPHPAQVVMGEYVRSRIIKTLRGATDVVFSHFHGDHVPLPDANPYQLGAQDAFALCRTARFWSKGPDGLSDAMSRRREALCNMLGRDLPNVEGQEQGPLRFSHSVAHGEPDTHLGTVMMTRIEGGDTVFVHASDIQLLDSEAVSLILAWRPDIVLAGGPPLYLSWLGLEQRERAWENALQLVHAVDTVVLDHHLLRSEEGLYWLERLASKTSHRVISAAAFMRRPLRLLEAWRRQLYEQMPVPDGWHEAYARGDLVTNVHQAYEWAFLAA
jgi:predicted metallo-beta-lactamase superfamily hydrolase